MNSSVFLKQANSLTAEALLGMRVKHIGSLQRVGNSFEHLRNKNIVISTCLMQVIQENGF